MTSSFSTMKDRIFQAAGDYVCDRIYDAGNVAYNFISNHDTLRPIANFAVGAVSTGLGAATTPHDLLGAAIGGAPVAIAIVGASALAGGLVAAHQQIPFRPAQDAKPVGPLQSVANG
ncbi:MAG TPA: hypothetical protein VFR09_06495 [Alphaproteobacteria bacterium]|nr:hypothetical protein [Alphaproteobacteria bacterium]